MDIWYKSWCYSKQHVDELVRDSEALQLNKPSNIPRTCRSWVGQSDRRGAWDWYLLMPINWLILMLWKTVSQLMLSTWIEPGGRRSPHRLRDSSYSSLSASVAAPVAILSSMTDFAATATVLVRAEGFYGYPLPEEVLSPLKSSRRLGGPSIKQTKKKKSSRSTNRWAYGRMGLQVVGPHVRRPRVTGQVIITARINLAKTDPHVTRTQGGTSDAQMGGTARHGPGSKKHGPYNFRPARH